MGVAYGPEFTIAQIIALVLITPTLVYMISVCRKDARWKFITYAVFTFFISTICALLREFYAFDTFRTLEWIFILLTSVIFAYAAYRSHKSIKSIEEVA
ncbi:MAG: hypothetical protein HVN35_05845 [Methanobacteriaceae archaeon]|nr:hypothetical protein [Methanobacteriaceae archaeon]